MSIAGISSDQFKTAIQLPAIQEGIFTVADHTVSTGLEAGFVVHVNADGSMIRSRIVEGHQVLDHFGEDDPGYKLAFGDLIFADDGLARPDVVVMLHSHPDNRETNTTPGEAMRSIEAHTAFLERRGDFVDAYQRVVVPSPNDTLEYSNVSQSSPGHVAGVLAVRQSLEKGSIIMYRHRQSPAPVVVPLDDLGLELDRDLKSTMLSAMVEAGYKYTGTDFSFDPWLIRRDVGELAGDLFEPGQQR